MMVEDPLAEGVGSKVLQFVGHYGLEYRCVSEDCLRRQEQQSLLQVGAPDGLYLLQHVAHGPWFVAEIVSWQFKQESL